MACAETDQVEVEWVRILYSAGTRVNHSPGRPLKTFTALLIVSLQLEFVK
jgi:hypothetical protein